MRSNTVSQITHLGRSNNLLVTKEAEHATRTRLTIRTSDLRKIATALDFTEVGGFSFLTCTDYGSPDMKIKHALSLALATMLASASFAMIAAPARAADPVAAAALRASTWLRAQQQPDGGFSNGFAPGSDAGTTADAVAALAAAGIKAADLRTPAGATALGYLAGQIATGVKPGVAAKVALAVSATGGNPRAFGGHDLLADLAASEDASSGLLGGSVFAHTLSMLAFARAGQALPSRATSALLALQDASGGWAFAGRGAPDVDTTALAALALIANGHSARTGPAGRALGYLNSLQNRDGGFPYQSPSDYGTDSNTNSTALVALAHIASGDQPESWFRPGGLNALGHLVTAQLPSGAMSYQGAYPDASVLATIGALPALVRQNLR